MKGTLFEFKGFRKGLTEEQKAEQSARLAAEADREPERALKIKSSEQSRHTLNLVGLANGLS